MKHWIQWVALTFAVTLLATVVALTIERAQPDTVTVPGLESCDGVPCFGGIVSGKTSVAEAMQRVVADYGLSPVSVNSSYVSYPLNSNTDLTIWYASYATVDYITLESFAGTSFTSLGRLVNLLGPPTTVGWGTTSTVAFCFTGLCVENPRSNRMRVTPDWPITLMIYAPAPSKFMKMNQPWHGFGTYTPR